MKIKRQEFFLPDQRFLLRCIQYNPVSEQPSSQGLTNPHRRSTVPDCTVRNNPISCMQEHFSCVESYDLLAYQSRAFIRHYLVCDRDFLSSSPFCRGTGFGSQTGVDRSYGCCSFLRIPWRRTPTSSARLDPRLFARCTTAGRSGTAAISGSRDAFGSAAEPSAGAASSANRNPFNGGRQVSDLSP